MIFSLVRLRPSGPTPSGLSRTARRARPHLLLLRRREVMINTNLHYVQRALRHLLENARKFTRQGSVTLRVYREGQMVAFVVEDTGIGIPEEAQETIFGEFVKLDDYASGTGIGLPLARSIARKLGGDIVLDSSYTQGARFIMTLPV